MAERTSGTTRFVGDRLIVAMPLFVMQAPVTSTTASVVALKLGP